MREIRTSGLMSGDGKRSGLSVVTAPVLDSTSLMRMSERDARGPEEHDRVYSGERPNSFCFFFDSAAAMTACARLT